MREREHEPPESSVVLERIVSTGASMSAGFGVGTTFAHALESALVSTQEIATAGELFFFRDPERIGEKLVTDTLTQNPTLVFGLDFPFWFGYGNVAGRGNETELRLVRLEHGLALLDRMKCTLVVGDFPDMKSAIGQMLRASQVPSKRALLALNARLYDWAEKRRNVYVLSMRDHRESLRAVPEGGIRAGRVSIPEDAELLLGDQLHPSIEGQAALALLSLDLLIECGVVREDEVRFDFEQVTERLDAQKARLFR